MTQNQIAFQKMQEEKRANRAQESIKSEDALTNRMNARVKEIADIQNAVTNYAEMERKRGLSFSEEMKNFGSAIGGFMKVFNPLSAILG